MNDALTQWLAGCNLAPGMIACGVRRPDGACLSLHLNDACPPEKMDAALEQLAQFIPLSDNSGLAPQWLTWTFADGQMRVVPRPDGFLLALVAEPNTPASQNLDLFSSEFLALDFSG